VAEKKTEVPKLKVVFEKKPKSLHGIILRVALTILDERLKTAAIGKERKTDQRWEIRKAAETIKNYLSEDCSDTRPHGKGQRPSQRGERVLRKMPWI